MQTEFRKQLPEHVLLLLDRIESFSGTQVVIRPNTSAPSTTDPNPRAPQLECSAVAASILIRDDHFTPDGICHELLHLERYWIEKVPRFATLPSSPNKRTAEAIDNMLEHLVIVPREQRYGFDTSTYWNLNTERNLDAFPWGGSPWQIRMGCFLLWTEALAIVTDANLRKRVRDRVNASGLLVEAEKFAAKVLKQVEGRKADAIATAARFLHIPKGDVLCIYQDIKRRQQYGEHVSTQ